MNTPAHLIAAAAVLAKPGSPKRNRVVALGALAPDLCIYVFFVWASLVADIPWDEMWSQAYWREPWPTLGAISNSAPLAFGVLALAVLRRWTLVAVFAGAALIHGALDFPLHADDAHKHFWPLTDWRFISPVSYWDPRRHGAIGAGVEALMVSVCAAIIWRRFDSRWVRWLSAGYAVLYSVGILALLAF